MYLCQVFRWSVFIWKRSCYPLLENSAQVKDQFLQSREDFKPIFGHYSSTRRCRGAGAVGGRREIVQRRGRWWLQRGWWRGGGAKCSVVLRPTDPLDNASTGGHWPSSRAKFALVQPSQRCRVSRLESKIIPSREEFLDRARVSVHAAAPIVVADRSMYDDGERKCASQRRRSWPIVNLECRNWFSIGRSGRSRIWRNLLHGRVYASGGDEKPRWLGKSVACRRTKSPAFHDAATNEYGWEYRNKFRRCRMRMYFACNVS